MTAAELLALAERVEGLTEADRDVDLLGSKALGSEMGGRLTASLDAVVSLIEQVLPGWGRQTGKTIGGAFYASTLREYSPGWIFKGQGFNEACALLAALLRAKAAEVAG